MCENDVQVVILLFQVLFAKTICGPEWSSYCTTFKLKEYNTMDMQNENEQNEAQNQPENNLSQGAGIQNQETRGSDDSEGLDLGMDEFERQQSSPGGDAGSGDRNQSEGYLNNGASATENSGMPDAQGQEGISNRGEGETTGSAASQQGDENNQQDTDQETDRQVNGL